MPSPSMTFNATGNVLASSTLAASGTSTTALDLSAKFFGDVAISVTFGAAPATSGVQVDAFSRAGAGPTDDTIARTTLTIPAVVGTSQQTIRLPTGKWDLRLKNLDAVNSVTTSLTSSTMDAIA